MCGASCDGGDGGGDGDDEILRRMKSEGVRSMDGDDATSENVCENGNETLTENRNGTRDPGY